MPKYTIYIEQLTFDTIIGILERERREQQKVIVDVKIKYKKRDDQFINYAEVAALIQSVMQEEKFLLLEEALVVLSEKMKAEFIDISSIKLKLSKPDILENCLVAVEIFKKY